MCPKCNELQAKEKAGKYAKILNDEFLQAEDGIRDQPRSRGLGDVYKRQGLFCSQNDVIFSQVLLLNKVIS